MVNDTVAEYLIKSMTCAAVLLKSRIVWRAVWVSVAVFFWRTEIRFVLDKVRSLVSGWLWGRK